MRTRIDHPSALRTRVSLRVLGAFLAMASLAAGCDDGDDDDDDRVDAGPFVPVSDAESAAIVAAINNSEIAEAELALSRAVSDDVLDYASRMIEDHSNASSDLDEILADRGITPVATDRSTQVEAAGQATLESLETIPRSAAFDEAYIQSQVDAHAAALAILESQLIRSTTEEEYREYLEDLRETIQKHLDSAQEIRAELLDAEVDIDDGTDEGLDSDVDEGVTD